MNLAIRMDTNTSYLPDYTDTSTLANYTTISTETFSDESSTSKYSPEELRAYFYYKNMASVIWKYVSGFVICIGIIGNTLSALVMTRPSLKRTVSSLFFTVLAFVDTFCLLTGLLRYWILGLTDHDVRINSDAACKLHTFFVYWSVDFSGWILALVSAERCFAANVPHVYKLACTRSKAAISLIICAVLLGLVNCHYLFSIELNVKVSNTTGDIIKSCEDKPQFEHYQFAIFPWIDLIFYCLGPFLCILLCNTSIAVKVLRSKMATDHKSNNRLSSMTAILISVSVFYIVCTAPVAVYLIGQNFWFDGAGLPFYSQMEVYFSIAAIMSYLNNSMNFFLYCISGPRFRMELMKMFRCFKSPGSGGESSVSGL